MPNKTITAAVILMISFCAPKPETIEKIMENGVEVILNHLEPYRLENQPVSFVLEEEFVIDFEREDLAELGIGSVRGFDVDRDGSIFCLSRFEIFKFDSRGRFLKKFGTRGQGPGEYTNPGAGRITESNDISLYDGGNHKFLLFDSEGSFIKEIKNTSNIQLFGGSSAAYLDGNSYLIEEMIMNPESDKFESRLAVLDAGFQKIAELRERTFKENPFQSNTYNMFDAYNRYVISGNRVYAASQSNQEFEINVYDFSGRNTRSIKKEHTKVPISEEFKQQAWESYRNSAISELLKSKGYFQEHFPPIKNLYVDEKGRVLVETYEEGPDGEVMVDIFAPEGAYIGRKPLAGALARRFANGRMYAAYEKDSGFQELVVSLMNWE
jgi:hypothetical protein